MKTEIVLIKKEEKKILAKMLQLYLHDISLYFSMNFDSKTGTYEYDDLDKYFNQSTNYAYFIKYDKDIAGFILVDRDENANMIIQEMFVLNNYKGKGVGKEAVYLLFGQYKEKWLVKSLPCSPKAENFWIKTINEYTKNNVNIEHVGKYNRAVFSFDNSKE